MYFAKISSNFLKAENVDWSQFKSDEIASKYDSLGTTLTYYRLKHVESFKRLHTRKLSYIFPSVVLFVELRGTGFLYPHVDHNISAAINYYINAEGDRTTFYEPLPECEPWAYEGRQKKNIYPLNTLVEKDSFVAESGEAFLFNSTKIHSVNKESKNTRTFLAYQWKKHSFQKVLESLTGKN